MEALITSITSVGGVVFTFMGDTVDFIVGEPYLLIGLGIMVVGSAVGMLGRVIRA